MSTFRAFQTGLEAGQQQAKVRRQDDARRKATEAYGMGNYEGAVTGLMSEGLTDEASNFNTLGQQAQTRKQQQGYATALGNAPDRRTGMQNLRTSAMQAGDPNTMMAVDEALKGMDADQAAKFGEGMEFLGQTALSLKGVAPEARGQAAIEAIQSSPYANPQILAQIQQAAADGKITDDELDNFAMQTMSVAERVKLAKGEKAKYTPVTTRDGIYAFNDADPTDRVSLGQAPIPASQMQGAKDSFRPATPEEAAQYGAKAGQINTADGKFTATGKLGELTPFQEETVKRWETQDEQERSEKRTKLENAIGSTENSISIVRKILANPKAPGRYGIGGMMPAFPGEDAAAQALIDQVKGAAFLQAFESLKGGGTITEVEGRQATAAITRLGAQQQDWESAKQAAAELIAIMEKSAERSRKSLASLSKPAGETKTRVGVPPLIAKPQTAAGIPDGVDPEDWKFMPEEMKALFQ
jgi:hypothetical protein